MLLALPGVIEHEWSIPAGSLLPGKMYTFQLTVTSQDGRTASAQARISVWEGHVEDVSVALRQEGQNLRCGIDTVSVGKRASLSATSLALVPGRVTWTLQWSDDERGQADVDLYSQAPALAQLNGQVGSTITVVHSKDLAIPSPYIFVAATATGSSWCPITFNAPPTGGACTSNAAGTNMLELRCSGFVDHHAPLTYSVGTEVEGQKSFGKQAYRSSQTLSLQNGITGVFVRIADSLGSFRLTTPN